MPRTSSRPTLIALMALLGPFLVPLGALDVDWDFQPAAAYGEWSTYAWGPSQPRPEGHTLADGGEVDTRIRTAVEQTLASKGFHLVEPGQDGEEPATTADGPDFRIVYRVTLTERVQESSALYNHAPDVSWPTAGPAQVRAFSEGTLLIEIAVGDEVVWSGWATEVSKRPQKLADKSEKAVKKILRRFPPDR